MRTCYTMQISVTFNEMKLTWLNWYEITLWHKHTHTKQNKNTHAHFKTTYCSTHNKPTISTNGNDTRCTLPELVVKGLLVNLATLGAALPWLQRLSVLPWGGGVAQLRVLQAKQQVGLHLHELQQLPQRLIQVGAGLLHCKTCTQSNSQWPQPLHDLEKRSRSLLMWTKWSYDYGHVLM